MVVCMAAPVSPRLRRNRDKPAFESHSKIRHRRSSRAESKELKPTKTIPKELLQEDCVAMGYGLAGNEANSQGSLEDRIKAIVVGTKKDHERTGLDEDTRKLCSRLAINVNEVREKNRTLQRRHEKSASVPITPHKQMTVCESIGSEKDLHLKERNSKSGILYSYDDLTLRPKNLSRAQYNANRLLRITSQAQEKPSEHRINPLYTATSRTKDKNKSQTDTSSTSEELLNYPVNSRCNQIDTLVVQKVPDVPRNGDKNDENLVREAAYNLSKKKISLTEPPCSSDLASSNITDSEKILHKLINCKVSRHRSLYSPACSPQFFTLQSSFDRSDTRETTEIKSPREGSRSRIVQSGGSECLLDKNNKPTVRVSDAHTPGKSPSSKQDKLVKKKTKLSRKTTDLYRVAKEHPNNITRLKQKFSKYAPSAIQKKLQPSSIGDEKGRKIEKTETSIVASKEKSVLEQDSKEKTTEKEAERLSENSGLLVVRQCVIGASVAFGLVQVTDGPNGNGHLDGHGLVTIRMRPDDQGRFGFNVKGGADQGMPIIVSRVAPGTPADIAIPRLNEGDQVLFINGRDVSQHTHEQVVMFIRASRETHSGELVLIVRPNVYVGEETMEEPDFVYIPDSHQITSSATGANALEASLMLLQESLESGAALAQFEQLYRKKPGMTMNAARLEINIPKNRYRDISPYDQTRVILKEQNTSGGDYINANYVNMEIPGSGIVNRYIAAQGPLPKTCTDFWQMVWEQHSSLVVMLTTKVEKGRVKCHQYWPEMYETMDYGVLQITCVKEEETPSFAFREFNLTHVETNEERHISHMQYIAWPDHNVPDDPADFLEFVLRVRQRRMGMVEPTVVHCSAGIGRTGVLITMETAMCLIEANQPVYPLSIVRQMRDQRAMLIQTATQYKFVCEAILRVYNEELVKPLEDYQR